MGRSNSCFRIITCAGGDSAEEDREDLVALQNKSSSDERGRSFRKKTAMHRVLSNTASSKTPTHGSKATLESAFLSSPLHDDSTVPEKVSTVQPTEDRTQLVVPAVVKPTEDRPQFPIPAGLRASETNDEVSIIEKNIDSKASSTSDDVSRIKEVIYLKESETDDVVTTVEKDFDCEVGEKGTDTDDIPIHGIDIDCKVEEKLDESVVIFIQAAVRGFLARRDLLKLKKVVRLQAAVRGHLVRRHAIGALRCVQAIVKMQALVRARHARHSMENSLDSAALDKEYSATKHKAAPASVEKLLQNKFARQLMDSTPKTKPIRIKCDPAKPNSAWNWLERWMSVSPAEKTSKQDFATEQPEKDKTESVRSPLEISFHAPSDITDSKSKAETSVPLEIKENLVAYEADKSKTDELTVASPEKPDSKNVCESEESETLFELDCNPDQSGLSEANGLNSLHKKAESESEEMKHRIKRKLSNPAFISAQSKFEELASKKPISSSSYRDGAFSESKADRISLIEEPKTNNDGRDRCGGSECGTELSISSTLDSPDNRSEVGATEFEIDIKLPEQGAGDSDKIVKPDIDVKESTLSNSMEDQQDKLVNANEIEKLDTDDRKHTLANSKEDRQEKLDHVMDEVECAVVSEIVQKQEVSTPCVNKYLKTEMSDQGYPFSPESQATPASNVSSVKSRKVKTKTGGSSQKRKGISSANKQSPSNPKHDSSGLSSTEQENKDDKSGKRRNSFGFDQEPRESSGGNSSLPRFMQPTESARAKLHEHNSPRSSPDVQEGDMYIKKRHSLPSANGKQSSSPRIQRSMSQAQQGTKERKWQR